MMVKSITRIFFVLLPLTGISQVQTLSKDLLINGTWRAYIERKDSNHVVFNLEVKAIQGEKKIFIINDTEKLEAKDIILKGDSVNFRMPVFESEFFSVLLADGSLEGIWAKGTAGETQYWKFRAFPGEQSRFAGKILPAKFNITGKWAMKLTRPSTGYTRDALAEFVQKGNRLTGTVLTPSGDYRYLEGVVSGDSIKLSTFDGAHAYVFVAKVAKDGIHAGGLFYSGFAGVEEWEAVKDAKAELPDASVTELKAGFDRLDFTFPDVDGNPVSIHDQRFKNKVVIIQIMGSWCPNCMDETKFLSEYYDNNRDKGIEIISLAYEYSTDFARSQKSLRRFQKAFDVKYPMLITGVSVSDTLRTEKTLPQITEIKVFPTTIFIGKDRKVKSIHSGFYGPGSGVYFDRYKKDFFETVNKLLKEK